MQKTDPRYEAYIAVLKQHLRPAMDCTEPVTIAYVPALAGEILGCLPSSVKVLVSPGIMKNAAVVPNKGGLRGN